MFCIGCGKEIGENQKFCRYCGKKNESVNHNELNDSLVTVNNEQGVTNNSFNRDVLNNYLYNVRLLEVAKNRLTNKVNSIINLTDRLGHYANIYKPGRRSEERLWAIGTMIVLPVLAWIVFGWFLQGISNWFSNEKGTGWRNVAIFITIVTLIIGLIYIIWSFVQDSKDKADYKNKLRADQDRVYKELEQKKYLQSILPNVEKELNNIESLLDHVYSVNLIPSKFRNIYAAYFLYEYVSTSAATLSEALLHCDLDTIIQKLDTIIYQQEEIIIELAKSNALNEKIIHQNEQILNHAIQTEKNTAFAAQYTQIAADNTRVIAAVKMSEWLSA